MITGPFGNGDHSPAPKAVPRAGFEPAFPIIKRHSVSLTRSERDVIREVGAVIAGEQKGLSDTDFFGPKVSAGLTRSPSILFGDRSEIRLLSPAASGTLEYRIAPLAQNHDRIVMTAEPNRDYETYLKQILDLEDLDVMQAWGEGRLLQLPTVRCCIEELAIFDSLCAFVRKCGGVNLLPFISTGSVWRLAKRLSNTTGMPVRVVGPPPVLGNRANNKLWFADVVRRLFGDDALPPEKGAYGPAALTGHVMRFARRFEKIVVKVPDSAGSAGNFPVPSAEIRELSSRAVYDYLANLLSPVLTLQDYPLMIEVWEANVIGSPSVQFWIPDPMDGWPIIEGVFDQHVSGDEGRFIGAAMAELPAHFEEAICREGMTLALLFQQLGYFGRCSFDTIIAGADEASAKLHWIECNGRWGGVSLPMSLMNRLFPKGDAPAYVIVQRSGLDFPPLSFGAALNLLRDELFEHDGDSTGIVLTAPDGLERGTSIQFVSLDHTMEAASRRAERVIGKLRQTSAA